MTQEVVWLCFDSEKYMPESCGRNWKDIQYRERTPSLASETKFECFLTNLMIRTRFHFLYSQFSTTNGGKNLRSLWKRNTNKKLEISQKDLFTTTPQLCKLCFKKYLKIEGNKALNHSKTNNFHLFSYIKANSVAKINNILKKGASFAGFSLNRM